MNEDENGITPADVTSISIQRVGNLWWIVIEQGNGDVIKYINLTGMERHALKTLLADRMDDISFVDNDRSDAGGFLPARTI